MDLSTAACRLRLYRYTESVSRIALGLYRRLPAAGTPPPVYASRLVMRVARRVHRVFADLDARPFLGEDARDEFRRYAALFEDSLSRIDAKVSSGRLAPLPPPRAGRQFRGHSATLRIGVFIGSFDPFQMTHLAAALQFLASDRSTSDIVLVVPEGAPDPRKPRKTDYEFRFELLRLQLEGVFSPLIAPLDIGAGADTIGIVERIIALSAGRRLELTHLLGSDALALALRYLDADIASWRAAATRHGVDFHCGAFVVPRAELRYANDSETVQRSLRRREAELARAANVYASRGLSFAVDEKSLAMPSSTDFRTRGALTIVFPADAVLARLELLFRYAMNRPWAVRPEDEGPEYAI